MNLYELITNNPNKTPPQLARMAMRDADLVRSLLIQEVERIRRSTVREVERSTIRPILDGIAASDRGAMLATFKPERGQVPVAWGRASESEHRRRAAFLRTQAGGLLRTAQLHEDAADRIAAAGVTCLDDLEAAGVAA